VRNLRSAFEDFGGADNSPKKQYLRASFFNPAASRSVATALLRDASPKTVLRSCAEIFVCTDRGIAIFFAFFSALFDAKTGMEFDTFYASKLDVYFAVTV
jgi:hypothetical protein